MSSTYVQYQKYNPTGRSQIPQTPAAVFGNLAQYRNDIYNVIQGYYANPSAMLNDGTVAFDTPILDQDMNAFGWSLITQNNETIRGYKSAMSIPDMMGQKDLMQKLRANLEFGIGGIDYLSKMSGDQVRKYGVIYKDGISNNRITSVVEDYSLAQYRIASGNATATSIPFNNTAVNIAGVPTPVKLSISKFKAWSAGLNLGASCLTGMNKANVGGSLQRIYVIKKNKYIPGAVSETLTANIESVVYNADGSMDLYLVPAVTRNSPIPDIITPGTYSWNNAGSSIEVGDIIRYGTSQPTNICAPGATMCSGVDMPEPTLYCVTTHKMNECILSVSAVGSMGRAENQFPYAVYLQRQVYENVRNMTNKWIADLLYSDQNYAAGQRRPIPIPGQTGQYTYSDCDLIPFAGLGVLTAVEKYGKKIEHYFSSCYDVCGTAFLGRITSILANHATMNNAALNYDSANFTLTGDTKGVRRFEESMKRAPMFNQNPMTYSADQAMQLNAKMTADAMGQPDNSTMLFGARMNGIKEIYDSALAREHSDTLYLVPNIGSGFRFFAPDVKGLQNMAHPGINLGTLEPVKNSGQVVTPTLYSDDFALRHNMSSDQMEYTANGGCAAKYNAYMNVGLFPKAPQIINSVIFKFGFEKKNLAYSPAQPYSATNQPTTKVSLSEADCANTCMSVEKEIRDMFLTSYQDGVYA